MGNICQKFRNIFFSDKERQIIRDTYCIFKCYICHKNNDIFFCSNCKKYFCENCFNQKHNIKNKKDINDINGIKDINDIKDIEDLKDHKKMAIKMISIDKNEMNNENKFYCFECQELFFNNDNKHNNHDKIKFIKNEDITKITSSLFNIRCYNNLISSTYKSYKENYFHMNSVINLGEFYKELDEMDLSELEWWLNKFKKARKSEEEVKTKLTLNEEEKKLTLKLNDDPKLLSKIMFNQLILIDLSNNNIDNIEFLDNMYLPFLEYLDMSYNKIKDIKPIAGLKCKDLIEICLQTNEIEDIKPLGFSDFPKLQILRLEDNHFDVSNNKIVQDKYKNKIFYKVSTIEAFNEKYIIWDKINNINIMKLIFLNLSDIKGGDYMIRHLYYIIPKNNEIKLLSLKNNEIKDFSLLPRIQFPELQSLDLSMNNITNLKFLIKMEIIKLKSLYLDNNKINDISPLKRVIELGNIYGKKIFIHLKVLSLNDNPLNYEKNKKFFDSLKNIEVDIK